MKFANRFVDLVTRPVPLRTLIFRRLFERFPIGSWETRIRAGAVARPHYAWSVYYAALQAKGLGYKAISVVELGVAGGNGLLCLCDYADQVRRETGVTVQVVGFDTGGGLPSSQDSRDLLYLWSAGSFSMDRAALEKRLAGRAQLILGNVVDTIPRWNPSPDAPLGAVMFDLDLYSSTRDSLPLLTKSNVLPRVWCYLDDIRGYPEMALTDFIGEGAAIREFNDDPARALLNDNISQARIFSANPPEAWHQKMFIYHRLRHPQYDTCISESEHELRLVAA